MNIYDETEIDLKDLIAELLTKWVYILLCCALVAAVMLAYAFVKDTKLANVIPIEERIANAKEALSVEEEETVERIFRQYESYTQYKESLQKYYNDYLFTGDDFSNYVAKDTVFCMSTNVFGADSVIAKLSLSPEVIEEISIILPENEAFATINKRVTISSSAKNSVTLLNDDEDGVFLPNDYAFTLSIVAKSQEQCDRIEAIVTESINNQFSSIKAIDKEARLTVLGSNYNDNIADWLMSKQTEAINNLNNVENTIKNFSNNQINNLSNDQKIYYNLLLEKIKEEQTTSKTSKIKYLIVGIFGGGVISCGYILLKYLLDATIKTEDEIAEKYGYHVLKTIPVKSKKYLFVDKLVNILRNVQSQNQDNELTILATDIGLLMKRNKTDTVYIVNASGTEKAQKIAEGLREKLREENITVIAGTPESDPVAMKDMAKSDNVILLAETKKTQMYTTDKYFELFDRFGSNVLGSILLKEI